MLCSVIENVRGGLMKPQDFRKAEITRRTLNFALSSTAIVEPVFSSGILSLDLDWTRRFLLAGGSDGSFYIHDTFNFGQTLDHTIKCVHHCPTRTCHSRSISTIEWFPSDNGAFTTSGFDGWLCLWDANEPERPVDKYNHDGPVYRHQTNPVTGSSIAVCADGEVNLIDVRVGSAIQKLPEINCEVKEIRWNPSNQNQLIVGSRGGHLIEWDIRSTLDYICYGVDEVRLSRRPVVTRGGQRAETSASLLQAHTSSIDSMRFSSDGHELYTFGSDGRVRRWKIGIKSEPCLGTLRYGSKSKGHGNFAIDVADCADPPVVFVPKSTSILMCDMKDCRIMRELVGHFKQVNTFVYDEVYQSGYSGGNDASVNVWSGNLSTERNFMEEKTNGVYDAGTRRDAVSKARPLIDLDDDDD